MRILLIFLGWLVMCGVNAENYQEQHDIKGAPNVLSSDGPGECRYEDQAPLYDQVAWVARQDTLKNNRDKAGEYHECLIPIEVAVAEWRENKRLIIDTRTPGQWSELHVAGSLNIPSNEIRAKSFLKSRAIALLDRGENVHAMDTLCAHLVDAGFADVKVVVGGLSEWRWSGPIQKLGGSLDDFGRISAKDFVAALHGNSWVVAGIGFDPGSLSDGFDNVSSLKYDGHADSIVDVVRSEAMNLYPGRGVSVLFVSENGVYDMRPDDMDKLRRVARVYFLDGDLGTYQDYVKKRQSMMARLDQRPKKIKRCGE